MVHLILNAKSLIYCEKNSGNVFLGHLGQSSSYFPNTVLDHGGPSQYLLEFLWIMLHCLAKAFCNI